MNKDTRNAIERATQRARKLLEDDFAAQLDSDFDVYRDGEVAAKPSKHLSARQAFARERIVAAIEHKRAAGMSAADAARDFLRDSAFTALNRFVALKMLEARELVQQCITKGKQSAGFREFCGMAPGLPLLPDGAGYRLYIESVFDELSTEVKVLFDRSDPSSVLWPKHPTFEPLLELLNATELTDAWREDETIGWVYQFFNGQDERRAMRGGTRATAPATRMELAVRNQFFTPRSLVGFIVENTLGRYWYESRRGVTTLTSKMADFVVPETMVERSEVDPRDLKVLDPACGSGHFLVYAFDLLAEMYLEAWRSGSVAACRQTQTTLRHDFSDESTLRAHLPRLILEHNLFGVDIDARCIQIALLTLWMKGRVLSRSASVRLPQARCIAVAPISREELLRAVGGASSVASLLGDVADMAGEVGLLFRAEDALRAQATAGPLLANVVSDASRQLDALLSTHADTRTHLGLKDASAILELVRIAMQRYDVVLMNPPFGETTERSRKWLLQAYPQSDGLLYAAFVERALQLLEAHGVLGTIGPRTGFFLPTVEAWRRANFVEAGYPYLWLDLGSGIFEAAGVEIVVSCVLRKFKPSDGADCTFVRLFHKSPTERLARIADLPTHGEHVFRRDVRSFGSIAGLPFAYWATDDLLRIYADCPPLEHDGGRTAKQGLATADDFRFLRLWWEVDSRPDADGNRTWIPYAKGGESRSFYGDVFLLVNWRQNGRELRNFCDLRTGKVLSRCQNVPYYFRPGLTWSLIASRLALRALPEGSIFGVGGLAMFAKNDEADTLLATLAIANSLPVSVLVNCLLAAGDRAPKQFQVGILQKIPTPATLSVAGEISTLAANAWRCAYLLDITTETSHAFVLPQSLLQRLTEYDPGALTSELDVTRQLIDRLVAEAYAMPLESFTALQQQANLSIAASPMGGESAADLDAEPMRQALPVAQDDDGPLVSWAVGVAFGRFDLSLATAQRALPALPAAFAALPSASPSMSEGAGGAAKDLVFVDDEGHPSDLAAAVARTLRALKVEPPADLRTRLGTRFFVEHLSAYSNSRRKAPVYWQLATSSGRYSVWLYLHSSTRDTLYKVQNEYVAPKLLHEQQRLEGMRRDTIAHPSAQARAELAAQESFVDELRGFLDEVRRVAPLWCPHSDDGVVINCALLLRLVPLHRPWQKELESTWDALRAGDYDWSNLAMHFWPERVVTKCVSDRSLAIAHGLVDDFWVEADGEKLTPRMSPRRAVSAIIAERRSAAVQDALEAFLAAPQASAAPARPRGRPRRPRTAGT